MATKISKTKRRKKPDKKKVSKPEQKSAAKKKPISKKVSPAKKPHAKSKLPKKTVKAPATKKTEKRMKKEISEEERKLALRKSLLQKREEIIKEAKAEISKYIKGETRQLVDTALDDGDWSVVDLSEDISLRQLSKHKETLQKIDEALRKLKEGTYGICEECGDEISEERLKILPFAIYCTDCQEKREQLEQIQRKEGLL